MVPLLILASGCMSALQGTHLPLHFLLFCAFQVIPVKQQRSSVFILSALHHENNPTEILGWLLLTKPSLQHCVDEPTQPSILKVSWLCSSAGSVSLGSQAGSHRAMWRWRQPAQRGGQDRNVPQPQLNLHLGPSAEHLFTADHELFTTRLPDVFAAIAVVQIEGEKWNGIREWKKATPASISLSLLKKMSNHGSEKQNLWGVLLQAEKAALEGRRALICAFQPAAFQFTAGLYLSFINLGVFLVCSVVCALHFARWDVYFLFPQFCLAVFPTIPFPSICKFALSLFHSCNLGCPLSYIC